MIMIDLSRKTCIKLRKARIPSESNNKLINRLIDDHNEIEKYIEGYIKSKDGECIYEEIFGHFIVANHSFTNPDGSCTKCGRSPFIADNISDIEE